MLIIPSSVLWTWKHKFMNDSWENFGNNGKIVYFKYHSIFRNYRQRFMVLPWITVTILNCLLWWDLLFITEATFQYLSLLLPWHVERECSKIINRINYHILISLYLFPKGNDKNWWRFKVIRCHKENIREYLEVIIILQQTTKEVKEICVFYPPIQAKCIFLRNLEGGSVSFSSSPSPSSSSLSSLMIRD